VIQTKKYLESRIKRIKGFHGIVLVIICEISVIRIICDSDKINIQNHDFNGSKDFAE